MITHIRHDMNKIDDLLMNSKTKKAANRLADQMPKPIKGQERNIFHQSCIVKTRHIESK